MRPVLFAGIVGPDDVGVLQRADRLHLPAEAGDRLPVVEEPLGQDLQGDDLVQEHLPRLVHHPHAPLPQLLQQFVIAQALGPGGLAHDRVDQVGMVGKPLVVFVRPERLAVLLPQVHLDFQ